MSRALFALPAGRRTRLALLGVWLAMLVAIFPLAGRFEDAQDNRPVTFLPGGSDSAEVLAALERFPSGQTQSALTVLRREGGLTAADRDAIAALRADLTADRPDGAGATPPPERSEDGTTALLVTPLAATGSTPGAEPVEATLDIRERLETLPAGLEVAVTGPAGYLTDSVEVFGQLDSGLLLATAGIVLVLLELIYRSPIFWAIPFVTVLVAELGSRALGYLLAEGGVTINGQSGGILPVLVFGAGTDYALLIVARYREELRRHERPGAAMAVALRHAGPAVLASGATVAAALMTLALAEVDGTAGLGPLLAAGIAVAVLATLTLLPALLVVVGRRAFWPFVPRFVPDASPTRAAAGHERTARGLWGRVGEGIARRPRAVWMAGTAVLVVMALGLTSLDGDLTSANGFREEVEAVEGQQLIERAFPAGANAPTAVLVPDESDVEGVAQALAAAPGVAGVGAPEAGPPGRLLPVTLDRDPFSTEAYALVPGLRAAVGDDALVGGPSAEQHDLRQAAASDNWRVMPIALVVVLLVLVAVLRSLTAPLVMIATVVASFAAALGLGAFAFEHLLGFPGTDPTLPLLSFVFLVALGVDYIIFLMARVREEAARHGTPEGMVRGLAATGAVITSAGLVLAGTFSALASFPLVFLAELGLVIAVGVLLDTFLVRSVLVPALVLDLRERTWWPSRLGRRARS